MILSIAGFQCDTAIDTSSSVGYGVHSHISRPDEFDAAPRSLAMIRQAGIEWVRTGFTWSRVERRRGHRDYTRLDTTVQRATHRGVKILAVLNYDVEWARPVVEHLDLWLDFVRETVQRYHRDVTHWEVWNEQNTLAFWGARPDAADYALLLKATHKTIKSIDTSLTVVMGGLAGIPEDYIRALYERGAATAFDVMAVHPYSYPEGPERAGLGNQLVSLRQLMSSFGDETKPIWITEIGWPSFTGLPGTGQDEWLYKTVLRGVSTLRGGQRYRSVAVLDDPEYSSRARHSLANIQHATGAQSVTRISLDSLGRITANKWPILWMPSSSDFPEQYREELFNYVRDGGLIVLTHGLPFFRSLAKDESGSWLSTSEGKRYSSRFHVAWDTWWTDKSTPSHINSVSFDDVTESRIQFSANVAARFLTDELLEGHDRFYPLAWGSHASGKRGVVAAAYDFDSELTGGLIVVSLPFVAGGVSEQTQADYLQRSFLIAFGCGVQRIFWYEFQSLESGKNRRQDHFGLMDSRFRPKKSFEALASLIRSLPEGSEMLRFSCQSSKPCVSAWRRPDRQTMAAVWCSDCDIGVRGVLESRLGQSIGESPLFLRDVDLSLLPGSD